MTPDELIKQATTISEAATPGPWEPIDDYDGVGSHHGWRGLSCPSGYGGHGGDGLVFATHEWDVGLKEADIEFIAAARTLVPELAKALEQATRERDELQCEVADLKSQRTLFQNETIESLHRKLSSLERAAASRSRESRMVREEHGKLTRERDEARELLNVLQGRHQVASIAVASGLTPDATLDELYEHLAELRDK